MTYSWFQKAIDVGFAHPLSDLALFRGHIPRSATEVSLLPGRAYGTVCQHSFAMMIYHTVLLGDNSRHIGLNFAAEAQCELLS